MRPCLFLLAFLAALAAGRLVAADPQPIVGPGATREEVINAYGWPSGQSQAGAREILNYPQGTVTLESGKVERVDFSTSKPWPPKRPPPGPPGPAGIQKADSTDFWLTKYDDAVAEAKRRHARILALFTGPDWSPASKQFHDEVEFHTDFVNAFTGDFVFLRLEFATRSSLTPDLLQQNNRLRDQYHITVYPTLLVLSTDGDVAGVVDLARPQPGDTYRTRVISAVREVRDRLPAKVVEPVVDPTAVVPDAPQAIGAGTAVSTGLSVARLLVGNAFLAGIAIMGVLFWLVWRNWGGRAQKAPPKFSQTMTARIAEAASGVPTAAEMGTWPKEKLGMLVAVLAELDGFQAIVQPPGSDKDVVLKRNGDETPRVLICCLPGKGGLVPVKRLREFMAVLQLEGVETGWVVAPQGFAIDARAYADANHLKLIDGMHLGAQLGDLPPLLLPKVLAKIGSGRR